MRTPRRRPLLRAGAVHRQGRTTRSPTRPVTPVYEKNKDGTYACNPNTVPERAIAYRQLNGLARRAGPGRRGHVVGIRPRSAHLRRERRTAGRPRRQGPPPDEQVLGVIDSHIQGRQLGFLGEKVVNVLDVNLALRRNPQLTARRSVAPDVAVRRWTSPARR